MDQDQGISTADCFYCSLLYPEQSAPCPKCQNQLRFRPAQMLCEESVTARVTEQVRGFQAATDPGQQRRLLLDLLDMLFVYGPLAVQQAAAAGVDLDTLRRTYETSSAD